MAIVEWDMVVTGVISGLSASAVCQLLMSEWGIGARERRWEDAARTLREIVAETALVAAESRRINSEVQQMQRTYAKSLAALTSLLKTQAKLTAERHGIAAESEAGPLAREADG